MGIFGSREVNIQLTDTYADSISRLDRDVKAKLSDVQGKLFNNPKAKGLNLEKVESAVNNVYSIRVDDNYRIILLYPHDENGLFIFLYVDTHNKAYDWAAKFKYDINEHGGFQIYTKVPDKTEDGHAIPALKNVTDEQLKHLEIPECYWESLRGNVCLKQQLQPYKDYISEAAFFVLEEVINGMPLESIDTIFNQLTCMPNIEAIEIKPLFLQYSNSEMREIGVPEEYVDIVKSIKFESELSDLQYKLPKDAVQGLYSLLRGVALEDILKMANSGSKPTQRISESLKNDNSKSTVVRVLNKDEFNKILDYPMDKWRIFLHPQQRGHAYRHHNGPARVLGGAGTGKTVISVHHAKFLAQEAKAKDSILVTTYSNTLCDDIKTRAEKVCTVSEMSKITFSTVDGKAKEIVNKEDYSIKYNKLNEYWIKAQNNAHIKNGYDSDFLMDEWIYVIQAQNIRTKEEYLTASRNGRGKKLIRTDRENIWEICEQYILLMKQNMFMDIDYAENYAADVLNSTNKYKKYTSIVVDECQDLRAPAIRMLRALAGPQHEDDLFLAGDTRQSIFNKLKYKLSLCGVTVNNRSTTLKLNYRTTGEIYDLAFKLYKEYQYDDLDGTITNDDRSVCVYHGAEPTIQGFNSSIDEVKAVLLDINKKIKHGFLPEEICIVARVNKEVDAWRDCLIGQGFEALRLNHDTTDDKSKPGIRVTTMHRVKGMEFDCMYVVGVNRGILPPNRDLEKAEGVDEINNIRMKDANLLSVAITRARKNAWISYYGQPSEYIDILKGED